MTAESPWFALMDAKRIEDPKLARAAALDRYLVELESDLARGDITHAKSAISTMRRAIALQLKGALEQAA